MDATQFVKSKYLKASDMQTGQTERLRIADVTQEELGEEREQKLCLHFAGMEQALALNRTQSKRMIELFGGSTDGWINKVIDLTVIPTVYKGVQKATFAIDTATIKQKAQAGKSLFAGREYADSDAPPEPEYAGDVPF